MLELFHDAARADNFRIQFAPQLDQQRRHIVLRAGVDQNLREIIGRRFRFDVVIETRRRPAGEDRGAGDFRMLFQIGHHALGRLAACW